MYNFFYDVLQPSLKDLMLHYMDTDSFVLRFSECSLDSPIKANNKVPGELKNELGSKEIEEFIVLKPKTYSLVTHGQKPFTTGTAKEKGIKNENNGKHEDYYIALMDSKERIVEGCRIQSRG